MSLLTGQEMHRHQWQEFPIDNDVIQQVEELAYNDDQPIIKKHTPLFEWSLSIPIQPTHTDNTNTTK